MSANLQPILFRGFRWIAVLAACSIAMHAQSPKGWLLAGSKPTAYESGIDVLATYNGHTSAYLKAGVPVVSGFGTLMQDFRADHYLGKKVRFRAFLKTDRAQKWAGLWMRVDRTGKPVAFDNMHDRPVTGTTNWKQYDIVLDVPQDATSISLGVLLVGSGEVWLNGAKFEAVGPNVLPTNGDVVQKPDEPTNLDFEQ